MDIHEQALQTWLSEECQFPVTQLEPIHGDASFRRYFRVQVPDGSYVAMDAPLPTENCEP